MLQQSKSTYKKIISRIKMPKSLSGAVQKLFVVKRFEIGAGLSVAGTLGRTLTLTVVLEEHECLPDALRRYIVQRVCGQQFIVHFVADHLGIRIDFRVLSNGYSA